MTVVTIPAKRRAVGNRAPRGRPIINLASWQAKNLLAWFPMRPGFQPGVNYAPRGGVWEGAVSSALTTRAGEFGIPTLDFPGDDTDSINFPAGTGPIDIAFLGGMTISAWVRFVDTSDNFQAVMSKGITASSNSIFSIAMDNSSAIGLRMFTATGASGTSVAVVDPDDFPTEVWTHVAGVLVPETEIILYVNGIDKVSGSTTRTGMKIDAAEDFDIGDDPNRADNRMAWDGQIMDVRIYDKAMSPSEVSALWSPQTRWDLYQQPTPMFYPVAAAGGFNLYSGSNLIPRVFIGSDEILKIYEGSTLIWEK